MVGKMMPTTVKGDLVGAVLDASFHVELAGGGHYAAAALREKIRTTILPCAGITLNSL
jgi:enoyl reductase-like protein